MSNFGEKVKATIERLSQLPVTNIRVVIESEIDLLEHELRPLAEGVRVSFFKELQNMLDEAGHIKHVESDGEERLVPSVDTISKTYRRICEKKGLRGAKETASNPPEQAHRPITTPIAMKKVVAPLVTSQAPARPLAMPGATPKVKIEKDWSWREEYQRLRTEPSHDWTDQDEKIWGYLSQEGRKQGINPETEGYLFEGLFVDDTAKDTVRALVGKRKRLSINLFKA